MEKNKRDPAQLTHQISEIFERKKQSEETYAQKVSLRDRILNILKGCFGNSTQLQIVGSSANNLGTDDSDIDMCVLVDHALSTISILDNVRLGLIKAGFQILELRRCIVPLLRFADNRSNMLVDLTANNPVAIRNTHLIKCYTKLDERFQPLAIVIKLWAKKQGINDASTKSLSSYSLALLVIHYLQFACYPPVLPCLQQTMPDVFKPDSDLRCLDPSMPLIDFSSRNEKSLADLLLGFLRYYSSEFNFDEVISVRLGRTMSRILARNYVSPTNRRAQWRLMCIEEPFERNNTTRSVYDAHAFSRILNVFRNCYANLNRSNDLETIL